MQSGMTKCVAHEKWAMKCRVGKMLFGKECRKETNWSSLSQRIVQACHGKSRFVAVAWAGDDLKRIGQTWSVVKVLGMGALSRL